MIIIVGILLLIVVANIYLLALFPKCSNDTQEHYDVCIILGSPSNRDGSSTRTQRSRMDRAIALYKAHKVTKLIISGGSVKNKYSEAETMMHYALQQGVLKKDIHLEMQAKNSYENLYYAKKICDELHYESVLVVTSRYHVRRSAFFVKKFFTTYAMAGTKEKERSKHYVLEYIRMWNTLRIELLLRRRR